MDDKNEYMRNFELLSLLQFRYDLDDNQITVLYGYGPAIIPFNRICRYFEEAGVASCGFGLGLCYSSGVISQLGFGVGESSQNSSCLGELFSVCARFK